MNEHLDPVNAAIALGSVLFGPQLAAIIGPYAVILIAATVGAAWSLGGRIPGTRVGAVRYFLLLNTTALVVTVQIANGLALWLDLQHTTWMLAPIALLIGGVGDSWPRIMRWAIARAGRVIERSTDGKGDQQ